MGCVFCEIKSENNSTFVKKMRYGSVYLNFNQTYPYQCLYILNKHYDNLWDINVESYREICCELYYVVEAINQITECALINCAMLGNVVRHIHWHIIPRYIGDPNYGHPPWPCDEKMLSNLEYSERAMKIKNQLENRGM